MIITDGITIPHTKIDDNVLSTGMSLITPKNPVSFTNGEKINTIFAFCSKDNLEHLDALMGVANLIRETNFKEQVKLFNNEDELYNFLIRNS